DRDDCRDKRPLIAKGHGFRDERTEFELVFDELRGERGAVGELADILGAGDDGQMAAPVDKAGVAGAEPAVFGDRVPRRVGLLVIALEYCGGADQHLAILGDPDLRARDRPADGIWIRLAVRLQRSQAGKLGGTPDLLDVDPERAKEPESIGPERRA